MEETEVMKKQVGGSHYKQHKGLQPWNIIDAYGLNYYEGNILKYLLRDKTNRIEDLQKLIHYAEKELENITPVDNVDRTTSVHDTHRAVNSDATEGMKNLRLMQMYNAVERWLEDSTLSLADRNEAGVILLDDSRQADGHIRFQSYDDFFKWFVVVHPDQYLAQGGSKKHAEKMKNND